ncbi:hypothetical protein [Bifidobacterium biavatii]|uniref:L,D-transpeptidase catalytic domain-containing protein n=1 Tax=Bifidobacterium biavatii DSM 23969 TaxID=1437608 RepID=A0A086ZN20_9BIFI|nr:hypothetical protein [Bifidobacterium biavatii]KFI47920.1 L,D-transpeptidase catalytic domain-containing protein [Bifidobacterium biavatii DSM 23969]
MPRLSYRRFHNRMHQVIAAGTATLAMLACGLIANTAVADDPVENSTTTSDNTANNSGHETPAPADSVTMYRLYNPNSGEHFYTADKDERDNLLYEHWRDEGVGWYAPETSSKPVYRLYNKNAGDHHYTISRTERNYLMKKGWKYEGVGWYSDENKTVPLYRQYNPHAVAGSHNYTTSASENDALVKAGWKAEGIGWYAVAEGHEQQPVTMEEDDSYASISAMMNLTGTGTGYHTKIDIASSGGVVVSFGIQYEKDIHLGYPQYPGNTVFLAENVMEHATKPGPEGKEYLYLAAANRGENAWVRLSWYWDGTVKFFVNDHEIGRTRTTLEPPFIFATEGSVARNKDSIKGYISDVRIKTGDDQFSYGTMGEWNASFNYFGLKSTISKFGKVNATDDQYNTHGGHAYGTDFIFTGTADIPGNGPDKKPWTWDTSFSAIEPNTLTTGHPLSAIANIAQYRTPDSDDE